jgi:tagatose 6-phosphate kinase
MITTVTLNATMDKTCFLGDLQIGRVNRVPVMHCYPGGKGINAARVAHHLGCPVLTTGFVAGFNGSYIETELSKQGLLHDFVRVNGESRVSLNIIDRFNGKTTEILEHGPTIASDDVLAIKDKVRQVATYSSVIAICGSIPEGAPANLYADFIEIANQEGALTILDASGEALLAGIEARPTCVKPNEQELAAILGKMPEHDEEIYDAVRMLAGKGIACVAVSLGERGAVVGMNNEIFRINAPSVRPVNVVGSGDSFVGALCAGFYKKESLEECIRLAVASGTANVLTEEAGNIRMNDVKALLSQIEIEMVR